MKEDRFDRLLDFLQRLERAAVHYTLANYREGALSVEVYVPGEHWEVDFMADGSVEVERYRSEGTIHDESVLEELFAADSSVAATAASGRNDA